VNALFNEIILSNVLPETRPSQKCPANVPILIYRSLQKRQHLDRENDSFRIDADKTANVAALSYVSIRLQMRLNFALENNLSCGCAENFYH
jgi:hypothetical protein